MKPVRVTVDYEANMAYAYFRAKRTPSRTVDLWPKCILDLTEDGELIGIEFFSVDSLPPTWRKMAEDITL